VSTNHSTSMRTDLCGSLNIDDVGRQVAVCGWVDRRREHGEHLAFIDLRDHSGVLQCVVDGAADLRSEYVLRVTGTVSARPGDTANTSLSTGEVEVTECEVEILNEASPPPFPLDERQDVDEAVRLKHRYVDLRRARMQKNLRVRSAINAALRSSMVEQGFVEVETPMLVASTPEGARDFVVPSRQSPGKFYALPQSPQLFKQLCMVGGVDRYFQIARCLRDEDLRADRQFEFMQLDAEASFVGQDDVLEFITEAVSAATEAVNGSRPDAFAVMTWNEAMERYGSDKPDIRFGMELTELSEIFEGTEAKVFQVPCVKGICYRDGANTLGRNQIDELTKRCQQWGAKGLAWFRVDDDGALDGALTKFMTEVELTQMASTLEAAPGDLLLVIAAERPIVNRVLGNLRVELGRPPVSEGGLHFLWVIDFPMFEAGSDGVTPTPMHHPFTMPHEEDLDLLDGDEVLSTRAKAYDLVLNGWELGSGSVRIHRSDIQQKILDLIGVGEDEARDKFGFLLDAFAFGAPPHAGFAFGIDRLAAILAGEDNIREVIAFPKTQSGSDPLTTAPTAIDAGHLAELGLRLLPQPD
jgi:aspartyl-tRNA synthetase